MARVDMQDASSDRVTARRRLARDGEDLLQHWSWIVETLTRLREKVRLSTVQLKWIPEARAELVKLLSRWMDSQSPLQARRPVVGVNT